MRVALLSFLLGLVSSAAVAECRFGTPDDDLTALGVGILNNVLGFADEETDIADFAGGVVVTPVDLDRDGVDELCIHASTTATCSNGIVVCAHLIWSQTRGEILLQTTTHELGFGGFDGTGWPDLRSENASNDGYVYEVRYSYRDGEYRRTCVRVLGQWAEGAMEPPPESDCT